MNDDFKISLDIDFNLPFEKTTKHTHKERRPTETKSYYDKRGSGLDNLFLMGDSATNEWGIPETESTTSNLDNIEWVSFWDKSKFKNDGDWGNIGVHFFVEDYQFMSVWRQPNKHLELFKKCRAVISPDFSIYTDMPKAQQLWNHYRRQWLAKYWQINGVSVVSCITWDLLGPQPWHFYGIPKHTAIARSWVNKNGMKQERLNEFLKIIDRLEPSKIFIKCSETDERELRRYFDFDVIPPVRW